MAEERDFVMARLAAAGNSITYARESLDSCIALFLEPAEDPDGVERGEALEALSDAAGDISRAVESAQAVFANLDEEELNSGEPDSEDQNAEDDEPSD